jgi:hypothetical protein
MGNASKEINALMSEWAEIHRQRGWSSFISDGMVNDESYEAAPSKICFFLKVTQTPTCGRNEHPVQ